MTPAQRIDLDAGPSSWATLHRDGRVLLGERSTWQPAAMGDLPWDVQRARYAWRLFVIFSLLALIPIFATDTQDWYWYVAALAGCLVVAVLTTMKVNRRVASDRARTAAHDDPSAEPR